MLTDVILTYRIQRGSTTKHEHSVPLTSADLNMDEPTDVREYRNTHAAPKYNYHHRYMKKMKYRLTPSDR